eukprot:scaffold8818_cov73-Cyclotella_meneghiniana.AAC.4
MGFIEDDVRERHMPDRVKKLSVGFIAEDVKLERAQIQSKATPVKHQKEATEDVGFIAKDVQKFHHAK